MKYKYLGVLDAKVADYWNIKEHQNKPILVFDDRIEHVKERHLNDFGSEEEIKKSYSQLSSIIKKPDYIFYNESQKSLEYYKFIDKNICVAVRIKPGKTLKVRSWFPVKKSKIVNRQKKSRKLSMIEKKQHYKVHR